MPHKGGCKSCVLTNVAPLCHQKYIFLLLISLLMMSSFFIGFQIFITHVRHAYNHRHLSTKRHQNIHQPYGISQQLHKIYENRKNGLQQTQSIQQEEEERQLTTKTIHQHLEQPYTTQPTQLQQKTILQHVYNEEKHVQHQEQQTITKLTHETHTNDELQISSNSSIPRQNITNKENFTVEMNAITDEDANVTVKTENESNKQTNKMEVIHESREQTNKTKVINLQETVKSEIKQISLQKLAKQNQLKKATGPRKPPKKRTNYLLRYEPEDELDFEKPNNFTHPLNINLTKFVMEKIRHGTPIPHKPINPHHFIYLHKPASLCHFKGDRNKTILVLVKSNIKHVNIRTIIRRLWSKDNHPNMKIVFLLGTNSYHQTSVNKEARHHHDIIQQNFLDSYFNNTYKTVMAFNWIVKYCSNVDMIFFMDDDYYVLYNELDEYLQTFKTSNIYRGAMVVNPVPYRDKYYKWFVSRDIYLPNFYPDYLGGGAFVLSFDVVLKFYHGFPYVKPIPVDDAYLGIVAHKLSIMPTNDDHFVSGSNSALAMECSHNPSDLLRRVCSLSRGTFYSKRMRHAEPDSINVTYSLLLLILVVAVSSCVFIHNLIYFIYVLLKQKAINNQWFKS